MGGSRWPFKKQLQRYDFSMKKQNLTKYFKTGFTLSLVCKPLSFSRMRMKPRFHFGFTSFIMKMERNSRNYSQTVIQYLLNYGQKSTKISQKCS